MIHAVLSAADSGTDAASIWLPGLVGVVGVVAGALVSGLLAYLREKTARKADQQHALDLRDQDRQRAASDAEGERIRTAYLGLLNAIHDVAHRHSEWDAAIVASGTKHGSFAFGELGAALGAVQLLVPEQEAQELQIAIDGFVRSFFSSSTPTRTEVISIYRKRATPSIG